MRSTHRLWCVLIGLLNFTSADWMLHTPGGGPMNDRCPCLARELCPRVFGLSAEDFRYFGQLPVCADSRQVRCCGASLRVEVRDSEGSATAEGNAPQTATVGDDEMGNNNEPLFIDSLFAEVEANREIEETSKFFDGLQKLRRKPEVDILTREDFDVGVSRHRKPQETFSDELQSDQRALKGNRDMQISESNTNKYLTTNLDPYRKPRQYSNDDTKPQTIGESMMSNNTSSNVGQNDNSTITQVYHMYTRFVDSIQESLKNATEKFSKLQKTLSNLMFRTENQGMQIEAVDKLSHLDPDNHHNSSLEKTINDSRIVMDPNVTRIDRSMSHGESIKSNNRHVQDQEDIVKTNDRENVQTMTDKDDTFADNNKQFSISNSTRSENDHNQTIEDSDKLQNTNDDIIAEELENFQRDSEISKDTAEFNKEHVSYSLGEVKDTLEKPDEMNKNADQTNDTDVLPESHVSKRPFNAESISTEVVALEVDLRDELEPSESQYNVRETHFNVSVDTDADHDIKNVFEFDGVADEIYLEFPSSKLNINVKEERSASESKELDQTNDDNEEDFVVDKLAETEELQMSSNNINVNKNATSEILDEKEVSKKQAINRKSDDPQEMSNINEMSVTTDEDVDDDQTFRDVMKAHDIKEILTEIPLSETYLNETKPAKIEKESDVVDTTEQVTPKPFAGTGGTLDQYDVMYDGELKGAGTTAEPDLNNDREKDGVDDIPNSQETFTELSKKKTYHEVDNITTEAAEDVTEIYEEHGNSSETLENNIGNGNSNEDVDKSGESSEGEEDADETSSEEESDESSKEDQDASEESSEEDSDESDETIELENEPNELNKTEDKSHTSIQSGNTTDEAIEDDATDDDGNDGQNEPGVVLNHATISSRIPSSRSLRDYDSVHPKYYLEFESKGQLLNESQVQALDRNDSYLNLLQRDKYTKFNSTNAQLNQSSVANFTTVPGIMYIFPGLIETRKEKSRTPFIVYPNNFNIKDYIMRGQKNEKSTADNKALNLTHTKGTDKYNATNELESTTVALPTTTYKNKIPSHTFGGPTRSDLNSVKIKKLMKRTRKNNSRKELHETTNITSTSGNTNATAEKNIYFNTPNTTIEKLEAMQDNIEKIQLLNNISIPITVNAHIEAETLPGLDMPTAKPANKALAVNETNVEDMDVSASENLKNVLPLEEIKAFDETFGRRESVSAPVSPQTKYESNVLKNPIEEGATTKRPPFRRRLNLSVPNIQPRETTTLLPLPTVYIKNKDQLQRRRKPPVVNRSRPGGLMDSMVKENVTEKNMPPNEAKYILSTQNTTGIFRNFKLRNTTGLPSSFNSRRISSVVTNTPSISETISNTSSTPSEKTPIAVRSRFRLVESVTEQTPPLNGTKHLTRRQNSTGIFKLKNSTLSPSSFNSRRISNVVSNTPSTNVTITNTLSTPSVKTPISALNRSRFKLPEVVIKRRPVVRSNNTSQNVSATSFKRELMQPNDIKENLHVLLRNDSTLSFPTVSETMSSRNIRAGMSKQSENIPRVEEPIETKLSLETQTNQGSTESFKNSPGKKIALQSATSHFDEIGLEIGEAKQMENNPRPQPRNETLVKLISPPREKNQQASPTMEKYRIAQSTTTTTVKDIASNVTVSPNKPTEEVKMKENTNDTRQFRGRIRFQLPCQNSTANSKRPYRCSTPAIKALISEISNMKDKIVNLSSEHRNTEDIFKTLFPSRLGSKPVELGLKNNTAETGNVSPHISLNDGREIIKDTSFHTSQSPCQKSTTNSNRPVRCSTPAIKGLISEILSKEDKFMNASSELSNPRDVIRKLFPSQLGGKPVDLKSSKDITEMNVSTHPLIDGAGITKDANFHTNQDNVKHDIYQTNEPTLVYGHEAMKTDTRPHADIGETDAPIIVLLDETNIMKIILPIPSEHSIPKMFQNSQTSTVPETVEDGFVPPRNVRSGPVSITEPIPKGFVDKTTTANRAALAFALPVNLKVAPFRGLTSQTSPQAINPEQANTSPKLLDTTSKFQPIQNVQQMKEQHNFFLRRQMETLYEGRKRKEIQQVMNRRHEEQKQFQDMI